MATHFVPTDEIKRLTIGSYEHLAAKIDEAVTASAQKIFGEAVTEGVCRVGTFEKSVVVLAPDGRFAKVQFESAADGSIKLTTSEPVAVPVYEASNINEYLLKEARTIVNSILAHDEDTASTKLTSLMSVIPEAVQPTETDLVSGIVFSIHADRPWKRIYRERSEQINSFLGEAIKEIESKKLLAKFDTMLNGMTEDKLEGHRELVIADLDYTLEGITKLVTQLEAAGDLADVKDATETEEDHLLVTTFAAFTEDLKLDLLSVRAAVTEAKTSVKSVPGLGRLYDALAEESFRYEVASRFAAAMGTSLRASN